MMSFKAVQPKPEHEVAYQDIVNLLYKNSGNTSKLEILAIAAQLVGKLIAMQDQRVVNTDQALELVLQNIELGNQQVVAMLMSTEGNA